MSGAPLQQNCVSPIIQIANLNQNYPSGSGTIHVLRNVNLNIQRGEMVAIMGPSGSGKSTLLSILGLFLSPTLGSYRVFEKDVLRLTRTEQSEFRRNCIGFIFQSCNLVEHSTVYENLEFPLIYAGVSRKERRGRIHDALSWVNLNNRIRHPANLLSGGEQQRVAVARALVNHPKIILADEPTGQLDRGHSQLIMDYLEKLAVKGNTTVVVVTHDSDVAARCSRVCLIEDGILKEDGLCRTFTKAG